MADIQNCPALQDYLAGDECLENLAGLGEVAYIGRKSELQSPMTATTNTFSTPVFKKDCGLVKVELKEESQKIASESQGKRKGFNLTATLVFDAVNKKTSEIGRALNNLGDLFVIMPDGDETQILYDANKKIRIDSGGLTADTGAAASDDRITTANLILGPVKYPNLFVTAPTDGWDSLLASAQSGE